VHGGVEGAIRYGPVRMDPDEHSRLLAAESGAEDPTGWFERLYAAAERGEATVPWSRGAPNPLLVEWAEARTLAGGGHRAMVVGFGLGDDAEYVAERGFETVAFDIAGTAVRLARRRFPDSRVRYVTADLLDPPGEWRGAFDLVLESITVQSLPPELHADATARVAELVAPGGTLLVLSGGRDERDGPVDGPPWPLTRAEVDAFADGGLRPVRIEDLRNAADPAYRRWRAELHRPA
jgi:SAM-dependent methyltransferase